AVYGLKKTDGLYFYDTQGDVVTAYKYQPIRIQLRYGYDFRLTDFLSLVPQVGGAFNIINGSAVEGVAANTNYKSASSFSAFGALRLTAAFSDYFRLQITPEYDFGLSKNANCKMISNHDSTFKSWTDGFNLNIGLMIFF
ncbi:MAG: hypothetical protein IJ710_02930, partial [Prevotella sp.]|nr:hypothetical protein [Prevotella sp.]